MLTESFNSMTRQLDEARRGVGVEPRSPWRRPRRTWRTSSPTCRPACWCSTTSSQLSIVQPRRRSRSSAPSSKRSPAACASSSSRTASENWQLELALEGHRRRPCMRAARACRRPPAAATWWCSTTSPSSSRRSAPPPGRKSRGAWRTRSRIRSRRSSSRPSAWR